MLAEILTCEFRSLTSRRLSGRVLRGGAPVARASLRLVDLGAGAAGPPAAPSHQAGLGPGALRRDVESGAFDLFLPRRMGRLSLELTVDAALLAITLDAGLDGRFHVISEARSALDPLSPAGMAALAAQLIERCQQPGFMAGMRDDALRPNRDRTRLEQFFDDTGGASGTARAATLWDYALRFGPTPFFYEKLAAVALAGGDAAVAGAVAAAGAQLFPKAPGLAAIQGHAAAALGRGETAEAAFAAALSLGAAAPALIAAGHAAYRRGHGEFGVVPVEPAAMDLALRHFQRAAETDETGEAAFMAAAVLSAQRDYPAARLLVELSLILGDAASAEAQLRRHPDLDGAASLWRALERRRAHDGVIAAAPSDPHRWLLEGAAAPTGQDRQALSDGVGAAALYHAGAAEIGADRWRRAHLADGAGDPDGPPLAVWRSARAAEPPVADDLPKRAVLISPKGAFPFGGAERFLLGAAALYADAGYEVRFLGFEPPADAVDFAYPTEFCAPTPEALRAALIRLRPGFVHAVSGAIGPAADALAGLDIPLIRGLHFWSDVLRPKHLAERAVYADPGAEGEDPSTALTLLGPGAIYVNSPLLRDVVADRFGVAPLVIPSVELDPPDPADPPMGEPYALLLDGRASKGGFFALDLARRLPERLFVIVCPQSARTAIERAVLAEQLGNVAVLGRVASVDALIAGAAAVLVPSFEFVETFGRVPIEAALRGKPAIVADTGNLPALVSDPALVLPADAAAWAAQLERLFTDPPPPPSIPPAVSPALAKRRLSQLPAQTARRAAVVVGASLFAAPVEDGRAEIAALAEGLGAPIEVIVEDGPMADGFERAAAALAPEDAAAAVIRLGPAARAKPYRLVLAHPSAPSPIGAFFTEALVALTPEDLAPARLSALLRGGP